VTAPLAASIRDCLNLTAAGGRDPLPDQPSTARASWFISSLDVLLSDSSNRARDEQTTCELLSGRSSLGEFRDLLVLGEQLAQEFTPEWSLWWQASISGQSDASVDAQAPDSARAVSIRILEPFFQNARARSTRHIESDASLYSRARTAFLIEPPAHLYEPLDQTIVAVYLAHNRVEQTTQSINEFLATRPVAYWRNLIEEQFPVLQRLIAETCIGWSAEADEFAGRLLADGVRLREFFGVEPEAVLVSAPLGDRHAGGRAVRKCTFGQTSLAYKPRSADLHARLEDLFEELRQAGMNVKVPAVLNRGSHAWIEWITSSPVDSAAGARNYYRNFGSLSAVVWCLSGTDMHAENILAAGEEPVLIDVETLLSPQFGGDTKPETPLAMEAYENSPVSTGIFPHRFDVLNGGREPDITALGTCFQQKAVASGHRVVVHGTGRLERLQVRTQVEIGNCSPQRLDGTRWEARPFVDAFLGGFEQALRILANLSVDGPLSASSLQQRFRGVRLRVLLRSTAEYGELLSASAHPALLTDAWKRDLQLCNLVDLCLRSESRSPALAYEIESVCRGEVPAFYGAADSVGVWSEIGDTLSTEYFGRSGLTIAAERLDGLRLFGPQRLAWQAAGSINALLLTESARDERGEETAPNISHCCADARDAKYSANTEDVAMSIGRRLLSLADWDRKTGSAVWCDVKANDSGVWQLLPKDESLYDGEMGMLAAFAELGRLDSDVRSASKSMAEAWEGRVLARPIQLVGMSLGLAGRLYTALSVLKSVPTGRSEEVCKEVFDSVARHAYSSDDAWDFLDGVSGLVLVLDANREMLQEVGGIDAAMVDREIQRAVRHLVDQVVIGEAGAYWRLAPGVDRGHPGFTHGNSGAALALRAAARTAGRKDAVSWSELAALADDFTDTFFRPGAGWLDTRLAVPSGSFSTSWCNGAVGIGMYLASALGIDGYGRLEGAAAEDRLATAVEIGGRIGLGNGMTICHGDLAVAQLMDLVENTPVSAPVSGGQVRQMVANEVAKSGTNSGIEFGSDTLGLFNGAAGIATGLGGPCSSGSVLTGRVRR